MEDALKVDQVPSRSLVRCDARTVIAEKWASRRKQQQEGEGQGQPVSSQTKGRRKLESRDCSVPLCLLIKRSWREAVKVFHQPRAQTNHASKSEYSNRASFPSVLSFLQANAVKQQVRSLKLKHDAEEWGSLKRQPSLLKVLPANYDFQQAIAEMSHTRSRVFWLLDLSAIVTAFVKCRKTCKLASGSSCRLQFAYRLHHNANPKLLQLLNGLGVQLQVASKFDLDVCSKELIEEENMFVGDDPNLVSKQNSFYRRLILSNMWTGDENLPLPLAVDGPREVARLAQALSKMAVRRRHDLPCLYFTLKVEYSATLESWQDLWDSTHEAAFNGNGQLVGLAMALPPTLPEIVEVLPRLSKMLEFLETSFGFDGSLHLYLCNLAPTIDAHTIDWFSNPLVGRVCRFLTLDVSHVLVADASALCTRIIGVKKNEPGKIHYYIDDGCYGSLSTLSKDRDKQCRTIPLFPKPKQHPIPLHVATPSESDAHEPDLLSATVWGPTCDGLDKVCSDIQLPLLSRDHWLVFGDIGFCDVGTAFNGFDAPDIAYCVLSNEGYYAAMSSP